MCSAELSTKKSFITTGPLLMFSFTVSCAGLDVGARIPDPCVACSTRFFACTGADEPFEIPCVDGQVYSPTNGQCQAECD